MSLFAAKLEKNGIDYDLTLRYEAMIVHLDESRKVVWLWIPDLHTSALDSNEVDLYVWNPDFEFGKVVQLAKLDSTSCYKGLVHLALKDDDRFTKQISSLSDPVIERATLPNTGGNLQALLDAINPTDVSERTLATLRAIVFQALSQYEDLLAHQTLQSWLSSTVPTRRADLAAPSEFVDAMRCRPHLFAELARLASERRIVFLLGGKQSYLEAFIDGFQDYIQSDSCEQVQRLAHVTANLEPHNFRLILNSSHILQLDYRILDCLMASLAFAAVSGLTETTGRLLPGIFTTDMVGSPVAFASSYLRNAPQHQNHWECVHDFLEFLNRAAAESGISGKITIFLPFYAVEEIVTGDDATCHQLWQGLGALRRELTERPHNCPQIGLVVAAHDHPLDSMGQQTIKYTVLRIPPLSKGELDHLLQRFWGTEPDPSEVEALDKYSGGDPWFVFLVLRCLRSIIGDGDASLLGTEKKVAAIAKACSLAHVAVSGEGSADERKVIPDDVKDDVELYLKLCKETLRDYGSVPGAYKIFGAWKHSDRSAFALNEEIRKLASTWIQMGIVYPQAVGEVRGMSLAALSKYPSYQFCPAGELPLTFAKRLVNVVATTNR